MSELDSINLYPEMNKEIVKILSLPGEDNTMNLYAAKLITTLQEENERLQNVIDNNEYDLALENEKLKYERDEAVKKVSEMEKL